MISQLDPQTTFDLIYPDGLPMADNTKQFRWITSSITTWSSYLPTTKTLQLFRPDGTAFVSYVEISQQLAIALETVDQERQRADQERQRAEQERQRAERLAERLRADPEAVK